MNTSVQTLLMSFEQLADFEQREFAAEILRRTVNFDFPLLANEELISNAEELFLELDKRESEDEQSSARRSMAS